jgi:endoglucanase
MWRVGRAAAFGLVAHALFACRANVYVGGVAPRDAAASDEAAPGHVFSYLHASGAKILDLANREVRLRCINWSGFETEKHVVDGLHAATLETLLGDVATQHFNCIRLPYCNDALNDDSIPGHVDADTNYLARNPQLLDMTSLGILEAIVSGAEAQGLYVVLTRHAPSPDTSHAEWGGWDAMIDARWLSDWQKLARLSMKHPNLVAFDLHDEPGDNSSWGTGDAFDWAAAATNTAAAVLAINPQLLIIVSGIQTIGGQTYWAGGNLAGARSTPLLIASERLVYGAHDYGSGKADQQWLHAPDFPNNMPAIWDTFWGFLFQDSQAPHPVLVASFGDRGDAENIPDAVTTTDNLWLPALIDYVNANQLSFGYWALNPSAQGLTGLLKPGWQSVDAYQQGRIGNLLTP